MQNATLLEVSSAWSFGYRKYARFNFFFQVALENFKSVFNYLFLKLIKLSQIFYSLGSVASFPRTRICVGGKYFPALKTHTP